MSDKPSDVYAGRLKLIKTDISNPSWNEKPNYVTSIEGGPHEPVSEHRFMLSIILPQRTTLEAGKVGDYAECRHCGSIFNATEE